MVIEVIPGEEVVTQHWMLVSDIEWKFTKQNKKAFTPSWICGSWELKLEILKYGLKHFIEPLRINKTDLLTMFDFIHQSVKHKKDAGEVNAKMSYLASNYVNTYKPLKNT